MRRKCIFSIFQGDDGIVWNGRRLLETFLWWMSDCKLPFQIEGTFEAQNTAQRW